MRRALRQKFHSRSLLCTWQNRNFVVEWYWLLRKRSIGPERFRRLVNPEGLLPKDRGNRLAAIDGGSNSMAKRYDAHSSNSLS